MQEGKESEGAPHQDPTQVLKPSLLKLVEAGDLNGMKNLLAAGDGQITSTAHTRICTEHDSHHRTALHFAAQHGNTGELGLLLCYPHSIQ